MDYLLIGKILKFMWFILIINFIYNEVNFNMEKMWIESEKEILCGYDKTVTRSEFINNCNKTIEMCTYENETMLYIDSINTNYKNNHLYMQ
jgi:hypothetical protein